MPGMVKSIHAMESVCNLARIHLHTQEITHPVTAAAKCPALMGHTLRGKDAGLAGRYPPPPPPRVVVC